MPATNENLDDVISSLIDVDEEEEDQETAMSEKDRQAPADGSVSSQPVNLTNRAARQVRKIRENEDLEEELYLRVAVEGGGCAGLNYKLGFDFKTEEDRLFESEGIEIVIDTNHLMYLDGIQIDYPDGLDARGFTFDNPNASESCGCGTSFAV
ncbi:MAG: iron-sulfur cluster assembly accessory protein [Balneolaceae bacterium]